MRFIPSHIEPGTPEYDEYAEKLSQPYYRRQDPRGYKPLTIVVGGVETTEKPPRWFRRKVEIARQVAAPSRRPGHTAPRARERRAHRSAKATRGSPSDDDGPGEPERQLSDALTFAVALRDHLRAFHAVVESQHRDLGTITPGSYELLTHEIRSLRSTVQTFIEGERVAAAVGL